MEIKENDIVMCTVKSIEGTNVFVDIEGNGQGSIVFSEIAAGRIRNIREYVSVGKKIVCKVLKIHPDHTELTLRRVTAAERDEIQNRYKKQKTLESILRAAIEDYKELIEKIKTKYELWDFFDKIKEDASLLEKFIKKQDVDKIKKLIQEKREKEKIVKRIIILKTDSETGILDLKEMLKIDEVSISYLGSSQFSIQAKAIDYKKAEHLVNNAILEIEKKAKEKKAFFELREK